MCLFLTEELKMGGRTGFVSLWEFFASGHPAVIFAPICHVGPSPKEPSQGSHAEPPTLKSQLVLVIQDVSGPAFSSAPSFHKENHLFLTHHAEAL